MRICRTWDEGCRAAGIPVRGELRNGFPTSEQWGALALAYQTGRIDGEEFAVRLSNAFGGAYQPTEIAAIHDAWILGEYEGVAGVIDDIHAAGLPTAALSNTNHEHWVKMDDLPAFTRLRHRLASHILGLHKPDPAIYRALESQLGFQGSQIIFFDDLAENIAAARQAGWHAAQIDHAAPTDRQIRRHLREAGVSIGA